MRSPLFLQAAFRRGFRGEIRFFDLDRERQDLMQRIGRLLLEKEGMASDEIKVTGSGSLQEALSGTESVVIAIRPGGLSLRARDEEIAFSLGLLGQETVGVCGIAMACRTLPALIEIVREADRVGRDPWIFNFTN
ncbi:MAG: family 4 glycosyl hydrolase, partial [Thermodesulfobacteriota bacterium]